MRPGERPSAGGGGGAEDGDIDLAIAHRGGKRRAELRCPIEREGQTGSGGGESGGVGWGAELLEDMTKWEEVLVIMSGREKRN